MGMWVGGKIDGEDANRDIIWSTYPVSKNDIAKDATEWSRTGVSPNNRFACDAETAFIMYHWAPDMYVVVLL